MPSNSIESCARVSDTVPLSTFGQTKRPRSRRFENRHETITIPPQHFDEIAAPAAEQKHVPAKGILFELALHDGTESGEAAS
jgi:hypothetical protein